VFELPVKTGVRKELGPNTTIPPSTADSSSLLRAEAADTFAMAWKDPELAAQAGSANNDNATASDNVTDFMTYSLRHNTVESD